MNRRAADLTDPDYGGRGIHVEHEPWKSDYVAFRDWALTNDYKSGLEIDRKDNDKGYSPENCWFATPSQNCRNKRSNKLLTAFGETKTMIEWSEDTRCSVSYDTLQCRVSQYGWPIEKAISLPKVLRRPSAASAMGHRYGA